MFEYTIDDSIDMPLTTSVEVTINFPYGKGWLFFATPQLLETVGDYVEGTKVRMHLGVCHMIIVSEISTSIIDSVLKELYRNGELEKRAIPL